MAGSTVDPESYNLGGWWVNRQRIGDVVNVLPTQKLAWPHAGIWNSWTRSDQNWDLGRWGPPFVSLHHAMCLHSTGSVSAGTVIVPSLQMGSLKLGKSNLAKSSSGRGRSPAMSDRLQSPCRALNMCSTALAHCLQVDKTAYYGSYTTKYQVRYLCLKLLLREHS
jgi:hypothetical protein